MASVKQFPMTEQAESPIPLHGEAFARSLWTAQLALSADVAAIARILNGIERRSYGLPPCELKDREFADFKRICAKAKAIVRSMGEDVEEFGVEEVAHVICEGADQEYAKFEDQSPRVQAIYRRQAVHAVNAYWAALEGRRS